MPEKRSVMASRRGYRRTSAGERISYLTWGEGPAEYVFLHGGGQNAHTWDSVITRLNRPCVAVDLPGHGHSDWRKDRDYGPIRNGESMGQILAEIAPQAQCVIGMSLGGSTAIHLASTRPAVVNRLILVDVTPGTHHSVQALSARQRGATALILGPRIFATFEAMVDAAARTSPHRDRDSLMRGVRFNAKQLPGGTWTWRYDISETGGADFAEQLWTELERLITPLMLVRGGRSAFVSASDLDRFRVCQPNATVAVIEEAGHSVQSDQPTELAALISAFSAGR